MFTLVLTYRSARRSAYVNIIGYIHVDKLKAGKYYVYIIVNIGVNMPDESVISFRFSEFELEALKAHRKPAESLSLTAKRLLRQMLELSTVKSTDMSTEPALLSVDEIIGNTINSIAGNPKLDEKIESLLEERLTAYIASINQKFKEQEERIESLEKLEA